MFTEFFMGIFLRKLPLGRPMIRWEDNIKMDIRDIGCEDRR
jgi:hypothetical protein